MYRLQDAEARSRRASCILFFCLYCPSLFYIDVHWRHHLQLAGAMTGMDVKPA